jgi:ABC-type nitrate/sulfonate/bicarbonate transport system substrate-binding protein
MALAYRFDSVEAVAVLAAIAFAHVGTPNLNRERRKMFKVKRGLLAALIVGLVLTGCDVGGKQKALRVAIDWKADTTYAGFYIAQEKSYYARRGLRVDILEGNGAMTTAAAAGAGTEFSVASASAEATAIARSNGVPVKSVAVLYQRVPTVQYFRLDNPINKPADLIGKKVGLVPGSIGVGQFQTLLSRNAIPPDKVTVVFTGTDPAPVLSGQLDTMQSYEEAEALQMRLQGRPIGVLRLADFGVGAYGLNIIASDKMIAASPDLVRAFVAATIEGYEFLRDHPREAAEVYSRLFPEHDKRFVEESIKVVAAHLGQGRVGAETRERWTAMLSDLDKAGLLKAPVTVDDIVAPGFSPANEGTAR